MVCAVLAYEARCSELPCTAVPRSKRQGVPGLQTALINEPSTNTHTLSQHTVSIYTHFQLLHRLSQTDCKAFSVEVQMQHIKSTDPRDPDASFHQNGPKSHPTYIRLINTTNIIDMLLLFLFFTLAHAWLEINIRFQYYSNSCNKCNVITLDFHIWCHQSIFCLKQNAKISHCKVQDHIYQTITSVEYITALLKAS